MPVFKIYRFFLGVWVVFMVFLFYQQFILGGLIPPAYQDPRGFSQEKQVRRGGIYDCSGELIADTPAPGSERRLWDESFLHTVGYHLPDVGETGIELRYTRELSGNTAAGSFVRIFSALAGKTPSGADVFTTLDRRWQTAAARALACRKGAVVVLDPDTGSVLAMVSNPGFHLKQWRKKPEALLREKDAPLLNRAASGLYPPGSLFKLIVAAAALRYRQEGRTFVCAGRTVVAGRRIRDAGGEIHGRIGLGEALRVSCNSYFIRMGLLLGSARLRAEARRWGLGAAPDLPVPAGRGVLPGWGMQPLSLALFAIGQGDLLATPLQMARVFGVVASGGWLRPVRLVQAIRYPVPGGSWRIYPGLSKRVISERQAKKLRAWLEEAVRSGTGRNAFIPGLKIYGKTGTAETDDGPPHAWFGAVGEWRGKQRVVVVLVEHGGSGGSVAAPIAREIFKSAQRGEFW